MEFALVAMAIVIIIVVKVSYDNKLYHEKIRQRIKQSFGKISTREYSDDTFKSIAYYYNKNKNNKTDVDDITWNDLEMDEIYMLLNNTYSSMGEEYLYAMLHRLEFNPEELKMRDQIVDYFMTNEQDCMSLSYEFAKLGKMKKNSLYECMNALEELKEESIIKHILQAIGLVASVGLVFVLPSIGIILPIFFLTYNIITYYSTRAQFESCLYAVGYINQVVSKANTISALNIEVIQPIMADVNEGAKAFEKFRRGAFLIGNGVGNSGNAVDIVMDYVRMMFHIDIIKFYQMLSTFKQNQDKLKIMYEKLGFLDSCLAIASFRAYLPYYCKPELDANSPNHLEVEELYHPLIQNPVTNSIKVDQSVLITGSNASGKSTFLKTIAMNAILSQTIYTSVSSKYSANYYMVASSMALRDNLMGKESYYIVEIKSLKRIMDRIQNEIPVLCFVDEVLRGTNTLERIAASSEILNSMATSNTICFAATHDIELTHILEKVYLNYHFQEQIVDNNVIFDYKIYEGRAVSKNAIKLLDMIGYSKGIIKRATDAANHFLASGEWIEISNHE